MPTLAATWHLGEVFLVFLEFAMFFILIWLLITVFADLFRSHDISGWVKALWVIGHHHLPVPRHPPLPDRARWVDARAQRAAGAARPTPRSGRTCNRPPRRAAPPSSSQKLADLKDAGVIDDAEFEQLKAKALA